MIPIESQQKEKKRADDYSSINRLIVDSISHLAKSLFPSGCLFVSIIITQSGAVHMCQLKPIGKKDKCSIESAVDKVTIKKIGQNHDPGKLEKRWINKSKE